jgi:UDP-glucose 4-epimerase
MPKNPRILVTGGAGFIGSHLVDRLVAKGNSVRVIDNLSSGNLGNIKAHVDTGTIDFVKGDIRDASLVEQSVKNIDAVLHFAAVISVPFSVENPQVTYETNVAGTLNLLKSSAEQKVGKFVFISSCAVYGEPKYLPIDEMHPKCPISPYAESKLAAEGYCIGFHERKLLKSVVLRFFNVYGPRQGMNEYSGVITRFIERTKQKLPLTIYGDGSQTRDFVNVNDVADAVAACVERSEAEGEVFNIGSGNAISINELAETILELSGAETTVSHAAPRAGDIKNSYADISKAKKLLGYQPKFSLKKGLAALLAEKRSWFHRLDG